MNNNLYNNQAWKKHGTAVPKANSVPGTNGIWQALFDVREFFLTLTDEILAIFWQI